MYGVLAIVAISLANGYVSIAEHFINSGKN